MMTDAKKRTRCANCGERGHWAESCKSPFRSKADRIASEKGKKDSAGKSFFFDVLPDADSYIQ
eukprot:684149-Pyramimonas_sp.AAC.1